MAHAIGSGRLAVVGAVRAEVISGKDATPTVVVVTVPAMNLRVVLVARASRAAGPGIRVTVIRPREGPVLVPSVAATQTSAVVTGPLVLTAGDAVARALVVAVKAGEAGLALAAVDERDVVERVRVTVTVAALVLRVRSRDPRGATGATVRATEGMRAVAIVVTSVGDRVGRTRVTLAIHLALTRRAYALSRASAAVVTEAVDGITRVTQWASVASGAGARSGASDSRGATIQAGRAHTTHQDVVRSALARGHTSNEDSHVVGCGTGGAGGAGVAGGAHARVASRVGDTVRAGDARRANKDGARGAHTQRAARNEASGGEASVAGGEGGGGRVASRAASALQAVAGRAAQTLLACAAARDVRVPAE